MSGKKWSISKFISKLYKLGLPDHAEVVEAKVEKKDKKPNPLHEKRPANHHSINEEGHLEKNE